MIILMVQIFRITVYELMHDKYELVNEMTLIRNPILSAVIYLWEALSEAEEYFFFIIYNLT